MCDSGADDNMAGTGRAAAAERSKHRPDDPSHCNVQPFNLLTVLMQLLPESFTMSDCSGVCVRACV